MGEILRLIGLTQDGGLVPLVAVGMAVWVVMSIQALKKDVNRLGVDHKKLEKLIGDLAVKVDGIAAQLGERVAAVEGKVAALDGKVEAVEGRVAAVEGRVAAVEGTVAAIDGKLDVLIALQRPRD